MNTMSDIIIKQKVIDSILENISSLQLNNQCCRVSQNTNNEIHQKSSENKENNVKKIWKTKIETIIEITPILLLGNKKINVVKSHLNLIKIK